MVSSSHRADKGLMTDLHVKHDKSSKFEQDDVLPAKQWEADGKDKKEWTVDDAAQRYKDNGLTWHECNDAKNVQMVPEAINADFGHFGGVAEAKEGQRKNDEALSRKNDGNGLVIDDPIQILKEEQEALNQKNGDYDDESARIIDDEIKKRNDLSGEPSEQEIAEFIKVLVDQNVTSARLPQKNGHWEEDEGNSKWIPDKDAIVTWRKDGKTYTDTYENIMERYQIDGIDYVNKEPDFSGIEDSLVKHVELNDFSTTRTGKDGTYDMANIAAAERLSSETGEVWTPQLVKKYMAENGLTWHECADRKTVRAIPVEINAAFIHTGGISVEKSFEAIAKVLDERIGLGKGIALERNSGYARVSSMAEMRRSIEAQRERYREAKRQITSTKSSVDDIGEQKKDRVDERINEPAKEPIQESIDESVEEQREGFIAESVEEQVKELLDEHAEESFEDSIDESAEEPIDDFSDVDEYSDIPDIIDNYTDLSDENDDIPDEATDSLNDLSDEEDNDECDMSEDFSDISDDMDDDFADDSDYLVFFDDAVDEPVDLADYSDISDDNDSESYVDSSFDFSDVSIDSRDSAPFGDCSDSIN